MSAKTKVIIGADGAFSRLRNFISRDANICEKYISIQEWFECPYHTPYFTAIFDEEISDFYSWIIPKENYILLGSALKLRENTREKYDMLKTKLTQIGLLT